MVCPGSTGFLLDHPKEWLEAVRWMGQNLDVARTMGRSGVETIRNGYDLADWGPFFVDRVMPGAVPADWGQSVESPIENQDCHLVSSGRVWKQESDSKSLGPHRESRRSLRK